MKLQKAKRYYVRFLNVGLVGYPEHQDVLVIKDMGVLRAVAEAHVGVPVIIDHQDVDQSNVESLSVGRVVNTFINLDGFKDKDGNTYEPDAWAWAEIIVDDERGTVLLDSGKYDVSNQCTYDMSFVSDGVYSGIVYNYEVTGIKEANHIAIVEQGRYDTKIIKNSLDKAQEGATNIPVFNFEEKNMNLIKTITRSNKEVKNEDSEQKEELSPEAMEIISKVAEHLNTQQNESVLDPERSYDVGGKQMTGAEIMDVYKSISNEEKEADEQPKKDDSEERTCSECEEKKENSKRSNASLPKETESNTSYARKSGYQSYNNDGPREDVWDAPVVGDFSHAKDLI